MVAEWFPIVPLVKRRVTGQIAGNVGAYGNVGAVTYLTIYSLLPEGAGGDKIFFQMLGIVALIAAFLNAFFLKEPEGSHEEEELELAVDRTMLFHPTDDEAEKALSKTSVVELR